MPEYDNATSQRLTEEHNYVTISFKLINSKNYQFRFWIPQQTETPGQSYTYIPADNLFEAIGKLKHCLDMELNRDLWITKRFEISKIKASQDTIIVVLECSTENTKEDAGITTAILEAVPR